MSETKSTDALDLEAIATRPVDEFYGPSGEGGLYRESGVLLTEGERDALVKLARAKQAGEFNMNDCVWVRLQQRGVDHIASDPLIAAVHQHRREVNGWTRWQLWELMSTLGHLAFMGPRPPFETVIYLGDELPMELR